MSSRSLILAAIALLSSTAAGRAQCEAIPSTLRLFQGGLPDAFGIDVAVQGDCAVIGAMFLDSPGSTFGGAAHVYRQTKAGWLPEFLLVSPEGVHSDCFGGAVALDDNTVVIGAPNKGTPGALFAGAAYVFLRQGGTWTFEAKLVAPVRRSEDNFGRRLAIEGDTVIVGMHSDDAPAGVNSGSAFVFHRANGVWTLDQKLIANDASVVDEFGSAVALSGDVAVIGARNARGPSVHDSGAAYVFRRSETNWSQEAKLIPPDSGTSDWYGWSVAADGDTALVGAPQYQAEGALSMGGVFIFERRDEVWTCVAKLADLDDYLGYSVALQGDYAAAGAVLGNSPSLATTGAARLLRRRDGHWSHFAELDPVGGVPDGLFGRSVAIDAPTVVVGADMNAVPNVHTGAAYVFPLVCPPCDSDCDGDGSLTLTDFGCFQTKFALGDPYANCNQDDSLNLADFGCFQTRFALGCP